MALVAAWAIGFASPAAFAFDDDDTPEPARRIHVSDLIPEVVMNKAERYDVLMHLRIKKKHGIEYRQAVEVGEHKMTVGVHGPVVRKKTFGLGVEIRF